MVAAPEARMDAPEWTAGFIRLCLKRSRHYFAHAKCVHYVKRSCTLTGGDGGPSVKSLKSQNASRQLQALILWTVLRVEPVGRREDVSF